MMIISACDCDAVAGNRPPELLGATVEAVEDTPEDFLLEATDADGDSLTYTFSTPSHGTITGTAPELTYTPAPNYAGDDTFEVTVTDGTASVVVTIDVIVAPEDDAPVAIDDTVSTSEDTDAVLAVDDLIANDEDVDTAMLTLVAVDGATHGTVGLVGTTVTFSPTPGFHGIASFTYTVSDGSLTDSALVTVNVGEVNSAPVAADDAVATVEDTALALPVAELLANDTDTDGDTLTLTSVHSPVGGTVVLEDGIVTFTPSADTSGTASFSYTIEDATTSDDATVTVTVSAVNDPPLANLDATTTTEDTPVEVDPATLLANDTDVDGPSLTVTAVHDAVNGMVVLDVSGIHFTPSADFAGAASFAYTMTDGTDSSTTTVTVTVSAVNDAPFANDDSASTDEDTALVLLASTLLANDGDVEGSTLSIVSVGSASSGSVAIAGSTITYTPSPNTSGTATFAYTVTDGTDTAAATVTVTIAAVNDGPVANDDSVSTSEDLELLIDPPTLLANDTDVDGPSLALVSVANAMNGTTTLDLDGVHFTPSPNISGTGSFTYTVSDGTVTATATVTVTITAVNDAPVASDDTGSTDENTALVLAASTLLANDSDVEGSTLSIVSVGSASSGSVALAGSTITYTPSPNTSGTATFAYTVTDGTLTDVAIVTVTVIPVNGAPVAASGDVVLRSNTAVSITLWATDPDSDPLTFTIVTPPANGTLTGSGNQYVYTPNVGYVGLDALTFRANDGLVNSNDAVVTIEISDPVCGDGDTEGVELCDDGNQVAGDGCRADCRGVEICSDGFVDAIAGEQCDDGNAASGDGCSSDCDLDPFSNISATLISGALSCTTNGSNTARKAAVDALGRFFVAMSCGGTGYVSVSANRGSTWPGPVSTGITGVQAIAIEGGPTGIAYVVAKTSANTIVFTRTLDAGVTWETPTTLATGVSDSEVSIDSFGDEVYVVVSGGSTTLRLLRNFARGAGAFSTTSITQSNVFHDVIVDKITGNVVLGSDNPSFRVRISEDQGVTFGSESVPAGSAFYSDWAGSNGFLYVSGTNGDNNIDVIPLLAPGTSTQVTGLPSNIGAGSLRAIDADAFGNAYVASQLTSGVVQLDRMLYGATTILAADARTISASGTSPSVAGLPSNNGALVAFTSGTSVYGAVVVY